MEAIEKIVHFDEEGNTILKLGKHFSKREAKVLVLLPAEKAEEKEWLQLAMLGGAFDFLNDASEDIYSLDDGIPFNKI